MRLGLSLALTRPQPLWVPAASASVHLDFARQRYYFNGATKLGSDFAALTLSGGCAFGSGGLVLDGVAGNFDVRLLWANLGVTAPLAFVASFTPDTVTGPRSAISADAGATTTRLDINNSNSLPQAIFVVAGGTQANITGGTAVIGTRQTIGMTFQTNNILMSLNGSTNGTADTSANLFTPTTLRIGKRVDDSNPFVGTIHHVCIFTGSQTQSGLNAFTAAVHAL